MLHGSLRDALQKDHGFVVVSPLPAALVGHASALLVRDAAHGAPAEVLVLVDRTDPELMADGTEASPHRSARGLRPFALPASTLVELAAGGRTWLSPLRRVTLLETADHACAAEDRQRLDVYRGEVVPHTFLAAVHLDTAANVARSNDVASRSGVPRWSDPITWVTAVTQATEEHAPAPEAPKVFSTRAVLFATFFGSPWAGASLIALNLRRTRRAAVGWALLAASVLPVLALVLLPVPRVLAGALSLSCLGAFSRLNHWAVGKPLRVRPAWQAFLASAVSLLALVLLAGVGVGVQALVTERSVDIAGGGTLEISRSGSEAEAQDVGALLVEAGVLPPGSSMALTREGGVRRLTLAFEDRASAHDPAVQGDYQKLADHLEASLGAPFEFVFVDALDTELGRVHSVPTREP